LGISALYLFKYNLNRSGGDVSHLGSKAIKQLRVVKEFAARALLQHRLCWSCHPLDTPALGIGG
jgi:hypothetical protein